MIKKGHFTESYPEAWTRPYFVDASGKSLSSITTISLFWAFAEKITTKGINLITTAIIARILIPEDFGLISMAGLFMGVVSLFQDYGLGAAIIYDKKVDQIALSTVFWISLMVQCLATFYLVVFLRAGYWGIVTGMICFSLAYSVMVFLYTGWIPKPVFDSIRLRRMFSYGKNLFLERIILYFSINIDYLVIGRILGASSLGIYFFAYTIPHTILTEFSQTITKVLFPALCTIEDDPSRFQAGYLKTIRYISFISFPAMIGLFCVAEPFIIVVFGEKYVEAVVPLKILCFSGMARSVLTTMGLVFNSKGRPDLGLKWNLCVFPVITIAVVIGACFDLKGVSLAMMLTSYLSFIAAWISMRLAKISFLRYLESLIPALAGSMLMLIALILFDTCVLQTNKASHIQALISMICLGGGIYSLFFFLFQKNEVKEIVALVKSLRRGLDEDTVHCK